MTDETRKVDRARQEQSAQEAKEQLKPRDQKSKFDEAIERQNAFQKSPVAIKANEDHVKYENFREFTKQKEEHDDKKTDKKKDEDKKDGDVSDKKADAKIAEHKVIGKGAFKDGKGDGQGDQGFKGGSFGGERRSKKEVEAKLKEIGIKDVPSDLKSRFAEKLRQTVGMQKAGLSQEVIDKVIQFVKIRVNNLGEKEIELILSEKIYRGLKLKVVTKKKGKVSVQLTTKNSKVRELLNEKKDEIKTAISKKGIEVEEIIIT
jgi:hypothetical protein